MERRAEWTVLDGPCSWEDAQRVFMGGCGELRGAGALCACLCPPVTAEI